MEGFEEFEKAMNIDSSITSASLVDLENHISEIETRKNALIQKQSTTPKIFEDQQFLREELRELIQSAIVIKNKLAADLKIGSAPRAYEVYAKLLDSIGNQYRALLDLNRAIFNAQLEAKKISNEKEEKKDTISMTSSQLLRMIKEAEEQSELKEIDAEFEVRDSIEKDDG